MNRLLDALRGAGPAACAALALAATAAWYALYALAADVGGEVLAPYPGPALDDAVSWFLMWSSGSIYAVLVLYRYARPTRTALIGLALAGAASYYMGVQISVRAGPFGAFTPSVGAAGALSAAFVGAATVFWGTQRASARLFVRLALAGFVGGAVIGLAFDLEAESLPLFIGGHALWQILTAMALYAASPQHEPPRSQDDAPRRSR